jgi:hypothetical protein
MKTAPTKSACVKTTPANERPAAAEMAATPTTPREHGGSSERNNHGKSCKRRGDFPEGWSAHWRFLSKSRLKKSFDKEMAVWGLLNRPPNGSSVHTWVLDVTRPDFRRTTIRTCRSARRQRIIRIAITAAACHAICSTLPEDAPLWPVHRRDGQCVNHVQGHRHTLSRVFVFWGFILRNHARQ